jgi:hypothetical protein
MDTLDRGSGVRKAYIRERNMWVDVAGHARVPDWRPDQIEFLLRRSTAAQHPSSW